MASLSSYSVGIEVTGRLRRGGYSRFCRLLPVVGTLMLACLAESVSGQTGTWTAPSGGYVYDATNREVRSVSGFIGSAMLGPSVIGGIDWISIAPNQTSALARQGSSQVWIPDLSAPGTVQVLNRISSAEQAFWASDASQTVMLTADAELVWLSGFNASPVAVSTWKLGTYNEAGPAELNNSEEVRVGRMRTTGVWSLLAADSQANRVLLALRVGLTRQIWFASSTVPPVRIPFAGNPVAAVFSSDASAVFVADAAGHSIVQIQNLDMTPVLTTFMTSTKYVNDPSAVALSSDGSRLFVADHTDSVIRTFDLTNPSGGVSPLMEMSVGTAPISLTGFARDRFVVNGGSIGGRSSGQSGGSSVFFLDTGASPKVSFVPRGQ